MKGKLLYIILSLLIYFFLVSVLPTKPLTPSVILIDLCPRPGRNFVDIVVVSEFKTDRKKKVGKGKWRRQSLTKYSVAICCVFGIFFFYCLSKQNTVVTWYLFGIFSLRHLWRVLTFWWEFKAAIICWLMIIVILIKVFTENQWLVRFVPTECLL